MPIGLSSKATVCVYLAGDLAEQPDREKCQRFRCKFLSCDDTLALEPMVREAEAMAREPGTDPAALNAKLDQILAVGVVGWENMPRAIEPAEMYGKILTPDEKWELVYKMQREPRLTEDERKKSASAQPSSTAGSAPAAASAAIV